MLVVMGTPTLWFLASVVQSSEFNNTIQQRVDRLMCETHQYFPTRITQGRPNTGSRMLSTIPDMDL
ncbi:hypothetical protein KC19_2G087900 [Ceratodon purpureus]|uniref:Secreted protein n=1 Tax=Ceratodon purpureus TaxID=3225 RepID=A0A8T0IRN2_CERPU|nr:hypothetical protein KC19_2G087900 [Ceratodon purpureus]